MVYVPNYRDAGEKLSICASRSNAATLLEKAQKSISLKQYGAAVQELNEAAKLDPTLDVDQPRETAECGEKYQQAIAELHRGHRNAGVDLLREVAGRRPDFEDAAQRLEDLAAGGNGLFGQPAQPNEMVKIESQGTGTEQAGWKDRFRQFGSWFTATPEVQYEPAPGTEPAVKGVLEKGRELLNDWFPAKDPSAPHPEVTPQPVTPVAPPSQKQISHPPVTPVQKQPPAPPVAPQKTNTPPNPKTQPQRGSVVTQTPAAHVLESRVYQTGLVPKFVAEAIRQYFSSQGCETQILEKDCVWIIQGRKGKPRQTADTGLAATIVMEPSFPRLRVSIGGGAWIEEGGYVAAGAEPAASLITGSIGMGHQKTLIDILWGIVERFVAQSGGRRLA
jgi:hypothetical protein